MHALSTITPEGPRETPAEPLHDPDHWPAPAEPPEQPSREPPARRAPPGREPEPVRREVPPWPRDPMPHEIGEPQEPGAPPEVIV
jgi:hypothetical protein